ncbi:hypothetical protein [Rahnella sp. ChDrAdgB13]|uniref:hypothetical protein n=1 Tax=Rahnella sp. ChDrAdgB13 TaxID=1850581 RepID=UPI001AD8534E|nr:hypothetical protein [Rahnella sp. ChDrAdgB13]
MSQMKNEPLQNEPHQPRVMKLEETRNGFNQAWQALCDAERVLHNLQAEKDRAKAKSADAGRQWDEVMTVGDGTIAAAAEELEATIAQAAQRAERLVPLIEAQALKVLDLRVLASQAASTHREAHRLLAVDTAASALEEFLQTLPLLVAQPLRQLIGLYQIAGLSHREALEKITDKVAGLAGGEHQAIAQAAIEQNADVSPALAAFPGTLPFEVNKALRYSPSPIQETLMRTRDEFRLRLAMGLERMGGR